MTAKTKHMYAIELTSEELYELGDLMVELRNAGLIPGNINLGIFMKDAFNRGISSYKADLSKN